MFIVYQTKSNSNLVTEGRILNQDQNVFCSIENVFFDCIPKMIRILNFVYISE